MGDSHPDTRKERTWYELCTNDFHVTVIIVEAPLTFGHSQLVLKTSKDLDEEVMFEGASFVIKKCLPIIRDRLPSAVENDKWKQLRNYTNTSGRYLKTLVLRASADEKVREYKVHLVPYFKSHLCCTTLLFHGGRDVDKNRTGGLLRWLGEQEKRLDDQIEKWRNTCRFPTALVESFGLIELANYLSKEDNKR
jgi:hypothetical protein